MVFLSFWTDYVGRIKKQKQIFFFFSRSIIRIEEVGFFCLIWIDNTTVKNMSRLLAFSSMDFFLSEKLFDSMINSSLLKTIDNHFFDKHHSIIVNPIRMQVIIIGEENRWHPTEGKTRVYLVLEMFLRCESWPKITSLCSRKIINHNNSVLLLLLLSS